MSNSEKRIENIWWCKTPEWMYLSIMNWSVDGELKTILDYLHTKFKLTWINSINILKDIFKEDNDEREKILGIIKEEFFNDKHPKIKRITWEQFTELCEYLLSWENVILQVKNNMAGKISNLVWEGIVQDDINVNTQWTFLKTVTNPEEQKIFLKFFLSSSEIQLDEKVNFIINSDNEDLCHSTLLEISDDGLKLTYINKWHDLNNGNNVFSSVIYKIFKSVIDNNKKLSFIKDNKSKFSIRFIINYFNDNELSDKDKLEILEDRLIFRELTTNSFDQILDSIDSPEYKDKVSKLVKESIWRSPYILVYKWEQLCFIIYSQLQKILNKK